MRDFTQNTEKGRNFFGFVKGHIMARNLTFVGLTSQA